MRLAGLEDLFPHLDLRSKKRSGYRKQLARMRPAILAQIDELVALRSAKLVEGRAARKALRPSSICSMVDSFCQIHGCVVGELNQGPFDSLGQMATTKNLCCAIDWLASERDLLRQSIRRIIDPILAVANLKSDMFPNLNSGEVRKRLKQVPKEPNHKLRARKEAKVLPYEVLAEIPGKLQKRTDAGGLSEIDIAWLLHDRALISVLLELVFRQRNIRECKLIDPTDANLVTGKLNPKMMHDLTIPDSVRAAYKADQSREFLMFVFRENETKGKRAQTEIIPLDLAATLEAYLEVRELLIEEKDGRKDDPGTLFLNRHGRALSAQTLRALVRRLTRNYVSKSVPPHLWRDIFTAHYRILLATGLAVNFGEIQRRLWHINLHPTEKYSHLGKALPGIAALNQQYRASQQAQRKEASEQLAQPELRQERAA
jgi:hypothetical protein